MSGYPTNEGSAKKHPAKTVPSPKRSARYEVQLTKKQVTTDYLGNSSKGKRREIKPSTMLMGIYLLLPLARCITQPGQIDYRSKY